MSTDPYKILNIPRDADLDTIKRAYRQAAEKYHPDRGGDTWVFQQVQAAYEQLTSGGRQTTSAVSTPPRPQTQTTAGDAGSSDTPLERNRKKIKSWLNGIRQELPLQSETSYFILVNVLDFYLTFLLLNANGIEANPLAAFVFHRFGFEGMLVFKLASVALVCLVVQTIAKRRLGTARLVLWFGIAIIGGVVIYSAFLLRGQFRFTVVRP